MNEVSSERRDEKVRGHESLSLITTTILGTYINNREGHLRYIHPNYVMLAQHLKKKS